MTEYVKIVLKVKDGILYNEVLEELKEHIICCIDCTVFEIELITYGKKDEVRR